MIKPLKMEQIKEDDESKDGEFLMCHHQLGKKSPQEDDIVRKKSTGGQYETLSDLNLIQLFPTADIQDIQNSFQLVPDIPCKEEIKQSESNNHRSRQLTKSSAAAHKKIPLENTEEPVEKTCTFGPVGCKFQSSSESEMESHVQTETVGHLQFILKTTLNLAKWQASELRKQTSIYETLLAFCHKHVKLEQKNRILELRLEALQRSIDEKSTLGELEFRPSSGTYYWRVHDFSQVVTDAILQSGKNVYSQNFYTRIDGYCMCMRMTFHASLNLSDVEVGLFVHFVNGKFDDYLTWPFRGTIKLSILDQNEVSSKRMPIVEHAVADADLQAFQRSNGQEKNPHGFGYKKFVTTCILQSGSYIRNDTLMIKCDVKSD